VLTLSHVPVTVLLEVSAQPAFAVTQSDVQSMAS